MTRTGGERLRALRELRELTLKALAEKAGLSVSGISDVERGKSCPSFDTLEKLASAFDMTEEVFLRYVLFGDRIPPGPGVSVPLRARFGQWLIGVGRGLVEKGADW